ncbi:RHS repeat-associated core domain-containing protein [Pseudomonas sp.]|uniref:RHS repeat domain-containing protein n=1 Tax=Pseudomonas sp. TaxID=306 RepID=UPI0025807DD8|nr:RHS repeat-associated core domain-containing protein [Pseudomonas sp.]
MHDEVLRTQGKLVTRTRYDTSGRLAGKAIHYRDAPAEVLPLLDKAYRYDASDNLVAEVLTQTQRRGMTNAANDENAHLEQIIGRFDDLPHTGKTCSGHNRYGYDLNEQLQTVQQSRPNWQATQVEDYKYDKAGNLFDGPKLNGLIKHNRVLVYQDKRYRYDRFGRLCEKRIGSNWVQYFEYDAEQRLVCVEQYRSGERERVVFAYDPLGRRISKEVYQREYPEPRRRVLFHWQGLRLLQEVQSGLASLYVYATPDSYEPLARIDGRSGGETIYYFHTTLAGLPQQLTDSAGNSTWGSDHKGWGRTYDEWHNKSEAREQNLSFPGQYLDRETGLHYNLFRFYDPEVGQFTQTDPIGLVGGLNFYKYAPNPITWIDPLGLSVEWISPDEINFSQRTIAKNNYAEIMKSGHWNWNQSPLHVARFNGQLVSYDNRRLDAAREAKIEKVKIVIVDLNSPHPDSTTGKTWLQKFQQRFSDPRNVRNGGAVPDTGLSNRPTHCG